MAVAAEIFADCHYCDLRAVTKRRVVVRDRGTGRARVRDIYACSLHERDAIRDAAAARLAVPPSRPSNYRDTRPTSNGKEAGR